MKMHNFIDFIKLCKYNTLCNTSGKIRKVGKRMTEKAKIRRKSILNSLLENLPVTDYDAVTIKTMCDAAGISVGTFYHYFGDKTGLVPAYFNLVDDYIENELLPLLNDDDELKNFLAFCVGLLTLANQTGAYKLKILYSFVPSLSSEDDKSRPFFAVPRDIIKRGQVKGQISTEIDSNQVAKMTVVILRGYCYDWAQHEGSYEIVSHVEQFAKLFIKSLQNQ